MASALFKKSWNDLKRRKSRTFFTVLTIALAIIGLSLFAVVPLMEQSMTDEINECNMYDLQVTFNNLELNETHFDDLENIDNVESVEGKNVFFTRIYIGERRNDAMIVGIDDFGTQTVDIVKKDSGSYPGLFDVLTDTGNSRSNLYHGDAGDHIRTYNSLGEVVDLQITGSGHTLSIDYANWGIAVFYTDMETVTALSNSSGYNLLSFDLQESNNGIAKKTVENIRTYLEQNTEFQAFTELPQVREENDWPGKEEFENMITFFYILAFITMFCSVFLIANTMHTLVSEQRKEIAQMKAVGATRFQIIKSYLMTSCLIGMIGASIGIIAGIIVAYSMESYLLSIFYGVNPTFAVHGTTVIISFLVGIAITILATLPALLMTLRITVREGMEGVAITSNGNTKFYKSLLRADFLPRSTQMGIRNITRKSGRSVSMIVLVALAVGMFLAIISFGYSLGVMVEEEFDNFTYDVSVVGQIEGGKPLTENLQVELENLDGVQEAEPFIQTQMLVKDYDVYCFGYNADPMSYDEDGTTYKGRWFTETELEDNANVIVISKMLARLEKIEIGDTITAQTASGEHQFEVIGLNSANMGHGMVGFVPITTLQNVMQWENIVTGFSVKTDSSDHDLIDRVSTEIEDEMLNKGYIVYIEIMYVTEATVKQQIDNIMNLMAVVGSLIIIVTMIGLMSTITMNIIERTKEIGMMRCLGSRATHIRSVFGTEGLTLGLVGWGFGIPLSYLVGYYLNSVMYDLMNIEMALHIPMYYILLSFILTCVITLIVIQPPLWRATRLKPGDALRYQ